MDKTYTLDEIKNLDFIESKPTLVFLYGDLWAGKTTLVQSQIGKMLWKEQIVNSPTYVYYNKYQDIYHFDLYRLRDYDEFVSLWGEEILDNNNGVIFIEWPQVLEPYYIPDYTVRLEKTDDDQLRCIKIQKK